MMKWEERFRDWLGRNLIWLGYAAVLLMGLLLRRAYLPHLAADLEFMNSSWYEALKTGGIAAVLDPALQFTYSPLHLYLWAAVAAVFGSMDTYLVLKLVSLGFEALLVLCCWLVLRALLPKERKQMGGLTGLALLWLNPVLLWNAAAWGQTDAYFALFCILAVLLLMKNQPEWGIACLGVALAWKLQAIFLLPLFLIAYFCGRKRFSCLWFLLIPGMVLLSGLPMMLVGQSPLFTFQIYLGQTDLYSEITYNYPNLYAIMGDALNNKAAVLNMFSRTGMVLCVAVLGLAAVWLIRRKTVLDNQTIVLLGAWCVLCCTFLLPRMHERYALVGELLLLCWAVWLNKPRGYAYVLLNALAVLSAYAKYLFRAPFFPLQTGGLIQLAVLCLVTWELVGQVRASAPAPRGQQA